MLQRLVLNKLLFFCLIAFISCTPANQEEDIQKNESTSDGSGTTGPSPFATTPKYGNQTIITMDIKNRAPQWDINKRCPAIALEREPFLCEVKIIDPDRDNVKIIFKGISPQLEGFSFDDKTGVIKFTPTVNERGKTYTIKFDLNDGKNEGNSVIPYIIKVRVVSNNSPPVVKSKSEDGFVNYDGTFFRRIIVEDKDNNVDYEKSEKMEIIFEKISGPEGLTVNNFGEILWKPGKASFTTAPVSVSFKVTDGVDSVDYGFNIYVLNTIENMINVNNTFYIDKFEATVFSSSKCNADPESVQSGADQNDYPGEFPPLVGYGQVEKIYLYACSVSGLIPSRFITWYQAKRVCENSGKRLCRWNELVTACGDTPVSSAEPVKCRVSNTAPVGPVKGGSMAECHSSTNIFDMIGNVREWSLDFWCDMAGPLEVPDVPEDCRKLCEMTNAVEKCATKQSGGYVQGVNFDPGHNLTGNGYKLVGNSFNATKPAYATCTQHNSWSEVPDSNLENIGFRCCKDF